MAKAQYPACPRISSQERTQWWPMPCEPLLPCSKTTAAQAAVVARIGEQAGDDFVVARTEMDLIDGVGVLWIVDLRIEYFGVQRQVWIVGVIICDAGKGGVVDRRPVVCCILGGKWAIGRTKRDEYACKKGHLVGLSYPCVSCRLSNANIRLRHSRGPIYDRDAEMLPRLGAIRPIPVLAAN